MIKNLGLLALHTQHLTLTLAVTPKSYPPYVTSNLKKKCMITESHVVEVAF